MGLNIDHIFDGSMDVVDFMLVKTFESLHNTINDLCAIVIRVVAE